jgi:hypothetical protein
VLADTAHFVQMGAGGDPSKRAYDATMSGASMSCSVTGETLKAALTFNVSAQLSPDVEAKPVRIPYFVVIMEGKSILAKQVFPVTLNFAPGSSSVRLSETVDKISIPLRKGQKAESIAIVVGFQLSAEQLRQAKS